MVGFGEVAKRHRKIVRCGIPILSGQKLSKERIIDILARHLAHILTTDVVFGTEFCGVIFAGMVIMNQCLLNLHDVHPIEIVEEAWRILQK